jgi:NADPH:quinone reductase-like Zn-dependent oxidoreductase
VVAGPWHTSDGNGTWAKYVLVDENRLYAVPDTLSDDVACQFATNPLTAVGFFKILEPELKHGDWILNNAAASALGRMVIKLAKKKGFKTINVVRRRNVVEELLALGADACIVSTEEDVVARVKELTQGQGVKVALDPVVGEGLATMTGACGVGGTVVVYGMMEGAAANVSVVDVLFRKVVVKGFWVGKWLEEDLHGEEKDEIMKETIESMADGTLAAPIGAKFSLQQIAEAVAECNKPGKRGKPVLEG